MDKIPFSSAIALLLYLAYGCGDTKSSISKINTELETASSSEPIKNTESSTLSSPSKTIKQQDTKPLVAKDLLYAWVDKLNVRDTPNLKGKLSTTVQSTDALEFTGEKSDEIESIVLRGVIYEEPWLKIKTPDKKEGWVFGGAVKRKVDSKGNAPITDTQFDYPYFGEFDLSTWKNLGTKEIVDEAEHKIMTFQKGNQILEIMETDMGESYYGVVHRLMDSNKNVVKERKLNFTGDSKELTERVKDYTSSPPKQYIRQQTLIKQFTLLKARPSMVNGKWTESEL